MSIRFTENQTIKSVNRSPNRTGGGIEIVDTTPTYITDSNNGNIFGADVSIGNPIAYRGYEHIPFNTKQYNENAV